MPLQIWLPLTGSLKNQGLYPVVFRNNRANVSEYGKLGQCFQFDRTSSDYNVFLHTDADADFMNTYINNHSFSICAWICTSMTEDLMTNGIATISDSVRFVINVNGCVNFTLANASGSNNVTSSIAVNDGKWHHVCAAYDVTSNDMCIYVDAVLDGTAKYTISSSYSSSWVNGIYIGLNSNAPSNIKYRYEGLMNDFRLYDHCLSVKEIHEISKALILHYPMANPYLECVDVSGYGNDGTVVGSLILDSESIVNNGSYQLNGDKSTASTMDSGTCIRNTYFYYPTDCLTVNFWYKRTNEGLQGGSYFVLGSENGYNLEGIATRDNYIDINTTDGTNLSHQMIHTFPTALNQWYMGTFVFNGIEKTAKVYMNGSQLYSINLTYDTLKRINPFLNIGWCNADNHGRFYNGNLSDFRIYATTLSEADIIDLYNTRFSVDKAGNFYCTNIEELEDSEESIVSFGANGILSAIEVNETNSSQANVTKHTLICDEIYER